MLSDLILSYWLNPLLDVMYVPNEGKNNCMLKNTLNLNAIV